MREGDGWVRKGVCEIATCKQEGLITTSARNASSPGYHSTHQQSLQLWSVCATGADQSINKFSTYSLVLVGMLGAMLTRAPWESTMHC